MTLYGDMEVSNLTERPPGRKEIDTRAIPGDPAAYFAGGAATQEAVEQVRKQLGLDRPLLEQFFRYVASLAQGDLGHL